MTRPIWKTWRNNTIDTRYKFCIQVSIQVFWSCIPYKKLESKDLNGLGWNRNASYFSFNLDGDWPIRRQNPYQHQFVNVNNNNYTCCAKMAGKEETPKCRKKTVTWTNEMIEDLIDDTSFASKSPFKKTWIKKTWIQVCVYTIQEILMNTHKFWREIQQTKWHFWEERRVFPFVLHYYVHLYCEGD
jgi:hypothetical protein